MPKTTKRFWEILKPIISALTIWFVANIVIALTFALLLILSVHLILSGHYLLTILLVWVFISIPQFIISIIPVSQSFMLHGIPVPFKCSNCGRLDAMLYRAGTQTDTICSECGHRYDRKKSQHSHLRSRFLSLD